MELQYDLVALDADGVILDYNQTYAQMFKKAYGIELKVVNPLSYAAFECFAMKKQDPEMVKDFHQRLHHLGMWREMSAFPGALDAVKMMTTKGYRCICVTSMPKQFAHHRLENLQTLGFPINEVIATNHSNRINPKKSYIEALHPAYFVDDILKNFEDLNVQTELVFLDNGFEDTPNKSQQHQYAHRTVKSLKEFAQSLPDLSQKS